MSAVEKQLTEAIDKIRKHVASDGVDLATAAAENCRELLLWVEHFSNTDPEAQASPLLDGCRATSLESASYIGLGLGRAAINSIRTQIDLVIGYTFFVDHPKEWELVTDEARGFKLRDEIYKYHAEMDKGFKTRLGLIEQAADASLKDVYQILSAHIHGQSPQTIPRASNASELISSPAFLASVVELQQKANLALSNFLLAVHAPRWNDLPRAIVERGRAVLSAAQRPEFFESK